MHINITHIDTACILLELDGYKILTDPTLDKAGKLYHHGYGTFSRKTDNPALRDVDLGDIDLILLSHHQHKDNFDVAGKAFAMTVANIISTRPAARALPGVIGLDDWEQYSVPTVKVANLRITATPAQHHPWWVPGFLAGKVIGFVIEFDGQQEGVIYITGDTVYFRGVDEVAQRYKVDLGIFHVGSVQFRYLTGFGKYTMDSSDLLKAVSVIKPNNIIPIHHRGWTHFKEREAALREIISSHPDVCRKTTLLAPGVRTRV